MTYSSPPNYPIPPRRPVHGNISHTAHFIATLLTFGLWAPFWAIAAAITSTRNKRAEEAYAQAMGRYQYEMAVFNKHVNM